MAHICGTGRWRAQGLLVAHGSSILVTLVHGSPMAFEGWFMVDPVLVNGLRSSSRRITPGLGHLWV